MPGPVNYQAIILAPFGALGLCATQTHITALHFLPPGTDAQSPNSELAKQAALELSRYFKDPNSLFTLPMQAKGTVFQQRVWAQISNIPCGQTRNYGQLANELHTAARALGQACGANPLPIFVPCHRVTAQKTLGGFAHAQNGWLIEAKKWLLQHEIKHR